MSAVLASHVDEHAVTRSTWLAVVALGLREGRRMLLSPVIGLLLVFVVLMAGVETVVEASLSVPSARTAYDAITFFAALYLGLLMYISAHLVTTSARRTGAEPQLAASALSARQRSAGLCLGVLLGPGGLALVLMVAAALLGNNLAATNADGFGPDEPPMGVVFLVQLALMLIGGGLFAVMWATWLRFPGSLPLGLIVLVFGTGWFANPDREPLYTWPWFGPYLSVPSWFDHPWTSYGSHYWHTAYLVGLCALAVCGTMLREREHRGRWVGVSAVVLIATGVAGAVQVA